MPAFLFLEIQGPSCLMATRKVGGRLSAPKAGPPRRRGSGCSHREELPGVFLLPHEAWVSIFPSPLRPSCCGAGVLGYRGASELHWGWVGREFAVLQEGSVGGREAECQAKSRGIWGARGWDSSGGGLSLVLRMTLGTRDSHTRGWGLGTNTCPRVSP